MSGIPLFIAEPTGRCILRLRRFKLDDHGADGHYHDASLTLTEDASAGRGTDRKMARGEFPPGNWPMTCACGYTFTDDDEWQVNRIPWYEGGGHRFAWGIGNWDGPPGAMIRATWRDYDGRPPGWVVFLPNGTCWNTNDRAAAAGPGNQLGPYWRVTGEPPRITVTPSIDDRSPSRPWHGWIRDGELVQA